ncbi:MAG: LuxR C-terminal-related transcriptional regulator, partial [Chloroflexota bacterium]|nr:LuxR C-terminal-related transcriptional regulator [Chloroflexota bacterium]
MDKDDSQLGLPPHLVSSKRAMEELLTSREQQVLQLYKDYQLEHVAEILNLSVNTVRRHLSAVREKLGTASIK